MTTTNDTVTIPLVITKDELWSNVFGSFEGSFEWWTAIEYVDSDWQKHGVVKLSAYSDIDTDEEIVTKEVTVDDLAKAYAFAVSQKYHHCGGTIDIYNMDECASDIILQIVMFRDVIYG